MTDARQPIYVKRPGLGRYYWQIALTIATACTKVPRNGEMDRIRSMPNRVNIRRSAHGSINSATLSGGFSTNSNTSAPRQSRHRARTSFPRLHTGSHQPVIEPNGRATISIGKQRFLQFVCGLLMPKYDHNSIDEKSM